MAVCPLCEELVNSRTQPVFGSGSGSPQILFVGEAPGVKEDQQGLPFVGRAGEHLSRLLESVEIDRDDSYITNVIKCRPPNNRAPKAHEKKNCRPYLDQQIELLRPKLICALGLVAAQALSGERTSLERLRERVHRLGEIPLICTYHPAYVGRMPAAAKEKLKNDLRRSRRLIAAG